MELDPYRLPRAVLPRHYAVTLEPELAAATFAGSITITADVVEAAEQIVLNAIELEILTVTVDGAAAAFTLDPASERLFIAAPVAAGSVTVDITFTGTLNDRLRGFYRSTYRDDAGVEHTIACSQMQATDCRRAFPCFDEPDFKATFGITLVVDEGMMAVSNAPERSRTARQNGRTAVAFEDTMAMSTYLVSVIVGRLEATDPIDVGGTPMRIVHVPGKGHLTQFGLDVGAASLAWFQEYYGIAYPGQKVDMVALPDFAAGAMENLGCITYRESLLLVDLDTSTQFEQQGVADVVSHELAHMWFGDLVTMRWWNGIWLNEAFATFMEVMAVEDFRPDWKRWTSFSLERSDAFEVDSLAATRTVEFPVRAPSECEGMFDVLTYQKGGALLRMLQQFLGEERFRQGVNHYLRAHSYANTETSDLWDGIEAVTTADGGNEPVRDLMDSWIWQAGFPLVSASLVGNELLLRQERFGFGEEPIDATVFIVPVAVRIGDVTHTVLLDAPEATLSVAPAGVPDPVVVVNAGGHGFFRVSYDDTLRARLGTEALSTLNTVERYNLVDDASAAFVAGRLSAPALLSFLEGFSAERELAVWQAVIASLGRLSRLLDGDARTPFAARVAAIVEPGLADLGWTPIAGEDDLRAKLRGLLVTASAVLGRDEEARRRSRALLDGDLADVDPELVSAATTVVAATGGQADFDRFVAGFEHAANPQEQLRNLYALAEFDDADLIRQACDYAFSGKVRSQNAPYLLNRCIANRVHGALAWKIVRSNWDLANATFPNPSIIRMVDPVKTLNTPEAVADVQGFFAEHPIKQSVTTLAQVLERQRVNAAVRSREAESFAKSLLAD
ncbi:MAG: putative Peptidase rane alanine aminopeptidase [Ilumatobacteraceae bacterium]|nr:putative Peptidase rane alanine aminopeptidase [Ilumatobacteraceae bacterium]